jgi:3-oxoadipate enol-lactonase
MVKAQANGMSINYIVEGDGPWLTFSHSLACNLHSWDEEARRLSDHFKVLRFDTRGHGGSSAPAGAYTLDLLADDLHGLLQALGVRSTHFVGLSMGGMIGQTFALRYPDMLKSLVLCDTSSRFDLDINERVRIVQAQGIEPMVAPTLSRFFSDEFRKASPDVVENVAAMIRSTPVPGYLGCCHAVSKIDLVARLKDIRCPTMVVVGKDDLVTPVAMAEEIHRAMPGSKLEVLPAAAHLSNLEQPEAFNQALAGFLRGGRHSPG